MRRGTLFWGGILILAGVLMLLNNLGILVVNIWGLLWPSFLVVLGIWILWNTISRPKPVIEHASVASEGAQRAHIRFQHGAGRLNLAAGAAEGTVLEGDFGGGLDLTRRREGDQLNLVLAQPIQVFPPFGAPGFNFDWRVRLSPNLPLSLELNTGAGESHVDLRDLLVSELSLNSGASATEITLPEHGGHTRAKIATGASSVKIRVPQGVAARIRARGGLASIEIDPSRFPRQNDLYVSPDFDTVQNRVDLNIETGVGSVQVVSA